MTQPGGDGAQHGRNHAQDACASTAFPLYESKRQLLTLTSEILLDYISLSIIAHCITVALAMQSNLSYNQTMFVSRTWL